VIVYFDTSALVKLLFNEPGSELAEELWTRADTVASSYLVYSEGRAALAAMRRAGRLGARGLRRAVHELDERCGQMHGVTAEPARVLTAGSLAEQHGLRGYDAVHLISALSLDAPRVVVATWDRELAAAVNAEGHAVVPAQRP